MLGAIRFTVSAHSNASPEEIIDVLNDWHSLPDYWHGMRGVSESSGKMLKVRFAFPGEGTMSYICDKETSSCTENYHNGPFTGFKRIEVASNGSGSNITVKWDIRLSGRFILFKGFVSRHFQQGTESALGRIAKEAESRVPVSTRY